jgi:TusA-related sulfurtransferase
MKIDTSGLSCPEPVLKTKKAIKNKPSQIEVLVDNTAALQNVSRFLKSQNYQVTVEDNIIKGTK